MLGQGIPAFAVARPGFDSTLQHHSRFGIRCLSKGCTKVFFLNGGLALKPEELARLTFARENKQQLNTAAKERLTLRYAMTHSCKECRPK